MIIQHIRPMPLDTKERIVYAAMTLFARKGYASTSVADILHEANVHAGSLYHFFPGKQDVLLAVLETYLHGIHPLLLQPAWKEVTDPIERVFALLEHYRNNLIRTECTYGCPIGSIALELHEPDPLVRALLAGRPASLRRRPPRPGDLRTDHNGRRSDAVAHRAHPHRLRPLGAHAPPLRRSLASRLFACFVLPLSSRHMINNRALLLATVLGTVRRWVGKFRFRAGVAVVLLVVVASAPSEVAAQTTKPLANARSTVATTGDFTWLVGHWEGRMTGGVGVADVIFSPPAGGLMIGVMRLLDGDKVLVVELISLVDTPTGVEMRFRHFSSTLEAYEPTYKQNMRLTTHAGDRDVFENAVAYDKALMSTQPRTATWKRIDADSFVGHSDIIAGDGKPGVVEVTYHRIK
jgi:AcrR family transcriptional regulator